MSRDALSAAQARRAALSAQGFGSGRGGIDARALVRAARMLGAIQIDSVNVLVRSHYLPLFSRYGAYDRSLLDRLAYRAPRRLAEYWAHEASFIPVETYPLLRWRMARASAGKGIWKHVARVGLEQRPLVKRVERAFEENGAMSASEFSGDKRAEKWWGWSDTKGAVEYLFWIGRLAVVRRRSSFERVYDLAERVLPESVRNAPSIREADAQRELMAIASRALGVATEADLRDYFRLDARDAAARVAELVEERRLLTVRVEGWKQQAYLDPARTIPRRVDGSALLSPFDSLIWNRARAHRLFDFHYRVEIYTPAHKRVHGYYVLPYFIDETLAARVDLKADRQAGALRVQALHVEPKANARDLRERLRHDLERLAQWLDLERVTLVR